MSPLRNKVLLWLLGVIISRTGSVTGTGDHTGTMFPMVFMEHGVNQTSVNLKLYVINSDGGSYTVSITSALWTPVTNPISLGTNELSLNVDPGVLMNGNEKADKTLYIEITQSVPNAVVKWPAVYLLVDGAEASDSSLVLPESSLGIKYYAVTYCEIFGYCQIAIAHDSTTAITTIDITLPSSGDVRVEYNGNVYTSGQSITIDLNSRQAVQIQCQCDLTSTSIRSTNGGKLSVFAGSYGAVVGSSGQKDFLVEQMLPVSKWGMEYIVYANPIRKKGDFIRVITSKSGTVIKISGYKTVKLLNAGDFIHRRIESGDGVYIRADKPVMVVQFTLNEVSTSKRVDSSMFLVQPYEQYHDTYTFHTLTDSATSKSYVTVFFGRSAGDEGLYFDGQFLNDTSCCLATAIIPEKSVFIVTKYVDPGRHLLYSTSNDTFGVYLLSETQGRVISNMVGTKSIDLSQPNVKAMVPGDNVDNDNDDTIDEDSCDNNDLLQSVNTPGKDCGKVSGDESNVGKKFMLVFPGMGTSSSNIKIDVSVRQEVSLEYKLIHTSTTIPTTTIPQNSHQVFDLSSSSSSIEAKGTAIHDKIVLVTTSNNVIIHASYKNAEATYLYLALPVNAYGLEYFAVTHRAYVGKKNILAILSAYADTLVSIHLQDLNDQEVLFDGHRYGAFEVISVTLDQYKVVQIEEETDLTGTYIRASNPVAVFSGADDYLEQLFPAEYFGKRFQIPKIPTEFETGLIRIIASEGNTICEIRHNGLYNTFHNLSNSGEKIDQDIANFTDHYNINCKKPVQVTLFTLGTTKGGFMTNIVPYGQYRLSYLFTTPQVSGSSHVSVQRNSDQFVLLLKQGASNPVSKSEVRFIEIINSQSVRIEINSLHNNESYAAYLFTVDTSSGSLAGMSLNILTQTCTPSSQQVNDGRDTDCDDLIDEEICIRDAYKYDPSAYIINDVYIPDFDIDGSMDEDCKCEVLVISSSTEMVSSTDSTLYSSETTSTTLLSSTTTQPTSSTSSLCTCPCSKAQAASKYQNLTQEKLEQIVAEIKKELTVEKGNLSSTIRKKTSAKDNRPSAKGVGSIGIVILCVIFGGLILSDMSSIVQHFNMFRENLRAALRRTD